MSVERDDLPELPELPELIEVPVQPKPEELGELEEFRTVAVPDAEPPRTPGEHVSLPWLGADLARLGFGPPRVESAASPRARELTESESPLRVTIPPVIDRPDLMGPGRRAASSALFLFTWILWAFVWLPALTALAWYLGFLRFRDQVWDEGFASLLSFLRFYGTVVGLATLVLLFWSLYNWWRFGGRQNRRHPGAPLAQEQVARDFGIEPEMLTRIQSARVVWIDVSPSGSIVDTRTRPVHWHHEPASEAWNTPEARRAAEKQAEEQAEEAEKQAEKRAEKPSARGPLDQNPFEVDVAEHGRVEVEPGDGGADASSASDAQRRNK